MKHKPFSPLKASLLLILFVFVASACVQNDHDFERAVREAVRRQMETYPESTLKDLYKSFFQDKYGPGHMMNDTAAANRYLLNELTSYAKITGKTAEPTGWQHNFYRVNLSVIKHKLVPYHLFLDAFIRSVNEIAPVPVEAWKKEWQQINQIIRSMELALPGYDEDQAEIEENLKKGNYVGHHSEAYTAAYAPHYRIISREIFEAEIRPLLDKQLLK